MPHGTTCVYIVNRRLRKKLRMLLQKMGLSELLTRLSVQIMGAPAHACMSDTKRHMILLGLKMKFSLQGKRRKRRTARERKRKKEADDVKCWNKSVDVIEEYVVSINEGFIGDDFTVPISVKQSVSNLIQIVLELGVQNSHVDELLLILLMLAPTLVKLHEQSRQDVELCICMLIIYCKFVEDNFIIYT